VKYYPDDAIAYRCLGDVLTELSCYEEALQDYLCSLQLDPYCDITYNNLGALLYLMEHYDAALHCCSEAIRHNPKEPTFYYNLARLFASLNNHWC
jgi:tetratricopeptide (TPR) repeat protein